MTPRFRRCAMLAIAGAAVMAALTPRVAGQSQDTPRLADGRPDLNGFWYRRVPPSPPVQRVGASVILNPRAARDQNAPRPATSNNAGMPKYKPELLARV